MKRAALLLSMAALFGVGCASTTDRSGPTRVSWDEAVEIVMAGGVESVFQTHSLEVTIFMLDGREFETVEPRIDLIFDVVEQCGEPCSGIMLVTE